MEPPMIPMSATELWRFMRAAVVDHKETFDRRALEAVAETMPPTRLRSDVRAGWWPVVLLP